MTPPKDSDDKFKKAMRDEAEKHSETSVYEKMPKNILDKHGLFKGTEVYAFESGATWARSYLEKSQVPQSVVDELVAALEHPDIKDQLTCECGYFEGDNGESLWHTCIPCKVDEALTKYSDWRKSNE